MSEIVAVYAARITIHGEKGLEDTPFSPPTLGDLQMVIEGAVTNYIAKQHGGIDHALFEVNCEATRTDQ